MSLIDTAAARAAQDAVYLIDSALDAKRALRTAARAGDTVLRSAIIAKARRRGWNLGIDVEAVALQVHTDTEQLVEDFGRAADAVMQQRVGGHLTPAGLADAFARVDSGNRFTGRLDAITKAGKQPAVDAASAVDGVIGSLTNPGGRRDDPLVAEMRLTRAWARLQPILERSGEGAIAVLTDRLKGTSDPYEVAATVAELPSWLWSHDWPHSNTLTRQVLTSVHPPLADAIRDQTRADRLRDVVNANDRTVRTLITTQPRGVGTVSLAGTTYVNPVGINY